MRRRILGTIVGVTALAVTLFGVPLGAALARVYRDSAIIDLERVAGAVAASAVPDAAVSHMAPDPVKLPKVEEPQVIALYRSDGVRMGGQGPADGDPLVRAALSGHLADGVEEGMLVVAVPVPDDQRVIAAVRAAIPESVVTRRIVRAWVAMAVLALTVLGLSTAVASARAAQLSKPIVGLAGAAGRLGKGDFASRATPVGVPEIDAAAAALNATAERLGNLVARERAFSADASHQLRTRLTGLRLGLESALLPGPDNGDPTPTFKQAVAEIGRMQTTLDDLLALARDAPTDRDLIDATELLDALDSEWRGPLAAQGRPLRTLRDGELASVRASTSAVRQILDVLVSNAAIHGAGTVTVHARALVGGAAFEVSDEGSGPQQDESTLFRRRSPGAAGHGIGLSMARSLAEAECGRLQFRATERGPVFALVLPAAE